MPPELPSVLKNLSKEVIKHKPEDVNKFAREYFERLLKESHYAFQEADLKL